MSQSNFSNPHSLLQNKSIHLPKNSHQKTRLSRHIDQYIGQLQEMEGSRDKIELLNLRKNLISKHGLSVERIDNLEIIFLHYCSHIFKTGKHMTFQRLEYEKSHMTMDRFFVFLKDFSLTVATIDGAHRQIFQKNQLVLIFKKASANAKDLNFQQFIACLQRIALLYFDAKTHYKQKQESIVKERQKRKQHYLKSLQRRKAAMKAAQKKLNSEEEEEDEAKATDQEDLEQNKPEERAEEENQNDKMVTEMLNDNNIADPEEQLKAEAEKNKQEEGSNAQNEDLLLQGPRPQQGLEEGQKALNEDLLLQGPRPQQGTDERENLSQKSQFDREELLELTLEQKIEYFYQMISVDNAAAFKKKMRELNLPLFNKVRHRRATSQASRVETTLKEPPRNSVVSIDEQQRMSELRSLIEERRERDRNISPKISKEQYEDRRKKRKQEEEKVTIKKFPRKKRMEVSELQTDLSSLSKMEFDKINFRKFNPQKLYQASEEDDAYLEEYGSTRKPQRSEKRILSSLETSDKNSQILLERIKKRAQEIENRERLEQSKYQVMQDVSTSAEHQLRKNRLVEKLLKMHKA